MRHQPRPHAAATKAPRSICASLRAACRSRAYADARAGDRHRRRPAIVCRRLTLMRTSPSSPSAPITPEAIAAHDSVVKRLAGAGLLVLTFTRSPACRLAGRPAQPRPHRGRASTLAGAGRTPAGAACRAMHAWSRVSTAIRWRLAGWARCAASGSCRSASKTSANRAISPTSTAPTARRRGHHRRGRALDRLKFFFPDVF